MPFPSNRHQLMQNLWDLDKPSLLDHIEEALTVKGVSTTIPLIALIKHPVKFSFLNGLLLYEGQDNSISSAWNILPPPESQKYTSPDPPPTKPTTSPPAQGTTTSPTS